MTEETGTTIAEFNEFESKLTAFTDEYAGIVYNMDEAVEMKAAKSDRLSIGKVISNLDAAHKTVKADVLEKSRLIDGERKRIKDGLRLLQDDIKGQLEAHEQKAFKHAAMLHAKVEHINSFGMIEDVPVKLADAVELYRANLLAVSDIVIDESYEEREADAALAKLRTVEILEGKITIATAEIKRVADEAKELEAKAKKDREDRDEAVRIEAEERANIAAAEARGKAEKDKVAAIAQAKKEAEDKAQKERDRIEAERKSLEDAEKAREADKTHRAKVNNTAMDALVKAGVPKSHAKTAVTAIAKGEVPAVKISY